MSLRKLDAWKPLARPSDNNRPTSEAIAGSGTNKAPSAGFPLFQIFYIHQHDGVIEPFWTGYFVTKAQIAAAKAENQASIRSGLTETLVPARRRFRDHSGY